MQVCLADGLTLEVRLDAAHDNFDFWEFGQDGAFVRALGDVDENIALLHNDGETLEDEVLVGIVDAGFAAIFPAVPRAHEHFSLYDALAQRAAGMGAGAVKADNFSTTIHNGELALTGEDLRNEAGRELANRTDFQ
jgi:hypothetical protein